MAEEDITRQHLASVCEDQEVHIVALRTLFSETGSKLEEQTTVAESIRLIRAYQKHVALRQEALELLAFQIAQLREIAQRQHALLREWPDPLEASRDDTRAC